ncbi:MAG: NAD(P)H-dependent oxidoreductase [Desulfarculus sp.]|nr:NAD(P)H-dependent oxidoreductase [Pseudomonadota bacterium]MBV1717992.1 NAD(P)H-dependent oxidoreductase [Desulfarculus sp.]MBU4574999.1 NAD(P)H-dependent oxidoreductase [Pseudomonadota bacterium]MBU4598021.1 NAD(P)H-dependent oxidoreductase [Pseudomonadota bacterium]MBV1739394.1 NAD(P)H-dependent oxidoreductase [Desulfarculus sp.]
MRLLVVLAHPDPASFNAAIAATAVESLRGLGHEVVLRDLHAEGFDAILGREEIAEDAPLPPAIEAHCRDLEQAQGIVIVHPNWWGMPPAIMKGWIDRVFRPGRAYRFVEGDGGEGVPQALLPARAAVVYNTGNTPPDREREAFGDPLEGLWRDCIFGLCADLTFHRRLFGVICISTLEQRRAWLEQVSQDMARLFPRE